MSASKSYVKIWSKKHSLRLGENWSFSPLSFKNYFGVTFPNQFIGYKNGIGYGYVDDVMLENCNNFLLQEIKGKGFEDFFEKRADKVFKDFLAYCKLLPKKADNEVSNKILSDLLNEFTEKEDEWMNYVWLVFLLDDCLTKAIQNTVAESMDLEEFLSVVVSPKKKTAAYTLKTKLLELAVKKNGEEHIDKELGKLSDKYSYFSILNMDEVPLSVSYFEKEVKSLLDKNPESQLREMKAKEDDADRQWQKLIDKTKHAPALLNVLEASRSVAYYREHRNDLRQECYFYARHLYLEIARRVDIDISKLVFATRGELQDYLLNDKKIDITKLEERQHKSAITSNYTTGGITYKFREVEVDKTWPTEEAEESSEIKGVSVFGTGFLQGKVRIISDVAQEGNDFREGDILVATTTNLTFLPLFGRATAIITDEGGLLTHAAIVARELKKPCVVGTKNATKKLKNGDRVNIDLNGGVIKKM